MSTVFCFLLSICVVVGGCRQAEGSPQETSYPTLQPASGLIAFTSTRDNGSGTIYTVNSDGTGLTRVTPPELYSGFPRWAPRCDKIAFSAKDGIYVVNPDGTGLSRLVALPAAPSISWSPDGKQLAFSVLDEFLPRGANIWVVNSNGTERRQLTYCSISCGTPTWHPLGESIYYFSAENDYTSAPIRRSVNKADVWGNVHETWLSVSNTVDIPFGGMRSISPDGSRFVLIKEVDTEEHTDIFTLDIESKEWKRLTNDQSFHDQPAWSPDGQQIVFVHYSVPTGPTTRLFPSESGIWIMNADGAGRFQVVEPVGKNLEPDWCSP